jgi:hypothetical protein
MCPNHLNNHGLSPCTRQKTPKKGAQCDSDKK